MNKDQELIELIAAGHSDAFSRFYTRYADKVYNTAISYSKNTAEAEEITQDVFLKIHANAAKFKAKSSVSTWVYRIAVNTALNAIKKSKRHASSSLDELNDPPSFEHPGVLMENKENAKILFQLIDSLIGTQKTAFILSYIEELSRQEVADIMEVSLKSVESLLQRAKSNLREKIEKVYPQRRISENTLSKLKKSENE